MSGHQSFAKYLLALDPGAIVISIDLLDRLDALSEVPPHLWARIRYVKLDAARLTFSELIRPPYMRYTSAWTVALTAPPTAAEPVTGWRR